MAIGAPENDELSILTDGRRLSGWTAVRVDRGVELLPSSFSVELTERYPGEASKAVVDPGSACEIFLGQDKILTGYIDLYWPHEDRERHVVTIQGRSRTEDLVDCSLTEPSVPPWEFHTRSLKEAAERICKPFDIEVALPDGDLPVDTDRPIIIQPGETCVQALEYLTRAAQALMWDDERGRLVLSRAGSKQSPTALVEGVNCEISETRLSMDQRYSVISVIGQALLKFPGPDGKMHLNYKATQKDLDVPRYRPKLIIMDDAGPKQDWPRRRAEWEVARRYGRSRLVEVTVTGWRDGGGGLWQPNILVPVKLPSLKMDQTLLLVACAWIRGERGGTQTVMTLMPKEGMMPAPFTPKEPIPGYQPATNS